MDTADAHNGAYNSHYNAYKNHRILTSEVHRPCQQCPAVETGKLPVSRTWLLPPPIAVSMLSMQAVTVNVVTITSSGWPAQNRPCNSNTRFSILGRAVCYSVVLIVYVGGCVVLGGFTRPGMQKERQMREIFGESLNISYIYVWVIGFMGSYAVGPGLFVSKYLLHSRVKNVYTFSKIVNL